MILFTLTAILVIANTVFVLNFGADDHLIYAIAIREHVQLTKGIMIVGKMIIHEIVPKLHMLASK